MSTRPRPLRPLLLAPLLAAAAGCQPTPASQGPGDAPTSAGPTAPTPGPSAPATIDDVDYQPTDAARADVAAHAAAGARFAASLYGQVRGGAGNLFLSPISIRTALAMTYGGARGDTEAAMAAALRLDLPGERLHAAEAALAESLRGAAAGDQLLAIANRLWGRRGEPFRGEYLQLTRSYYGAPLAELDFAADAEGARSTINQWVSAQTRGKIPELLPPSLLNAGTVLVLTNAIYFKGQWASRFDPARTKQAPFKGPGAAKTAAMMAQKARLAYAEDALAQALELPYVGDRLAMVIVLPKANDGLAKLEEAVVAEGLDRWLGALAPAEVEVALPRFKIEASFELGEPLKALGMGVAFGSGADFTGMSAAGGLFISAVVHKAFVEVNEEGTEAAAATGVVMTRSLPRTVRFTADHPFLFAIRDRQSGALLFLGRVVDPGA